MSSTTNNWQAFNNFQRAFYTNISDFNNYTFFEVKQNSFLLLNNMIKGYPKLANDVLNIYSPDVKALHSPEIIFALQRKFVNGFSKARIPQFVFWKTKKTTKNKSDNNKSVKKSTKSKQKDLITDIPVDVKNEIISMLFIDNKTFEYLKHTDKIQNIARQLLEIKINK